uniref:Uncharacterized protein n=1 Tax=Rhizophora mucronata TaxID=61149 RepID=A0A2P2Q4U4_RHIMU
MHLLLAIINIPNGGNTFFISLISLIRHIRNGSPLLFSNRAWLPLPLIFYEIMRINPSPC